MISDPNSKEHRVQQIYSDLNRKFEEEETQRKAKEQKIAYINLYGFPIDTQTLSLIDQPTSENFQVVVFYREGRNLKVGLVEPSVATKKVVSQLQNQGY